MILGGEVQEAINAVAEAHRRAGGIGNPEARMEQLAELGIEPEQAFRVVVKDARSWLALVPLNPTVGDVHNLLASAEITGFEAGFRLGRLYGGTAPA